MRSLVGLAVVTVLATSACGGRRPANGPLRMRPAGSESNSHFIVERPWKGVWVLGDFTRQDVEAIAALIAAETRTAKGPWRHLLSIAQRGKYVEVQTGSYCGTLCGDGYRFTLDKVDGRWTILERSIWQS